MQVLRLAEGSSSKSASQAAVWLRWARHELKHNRLAAANTVLRKALTAPGVNVCNPALFEFYVDFVHATKVVPAAEEVGKARQAVAEKADGADSLLLQANQKLAGARKAVGAALDFALTTRGLDSQAGVDSLWQALIKHSRQLYKSAVAQGGSAVVQAATSVRRVFRRALACPHQGLAELWSDYSQFEAEAAVDLATAQNAGGSALSAADEAAAREHGAQVAEEARPVVERALAAAEQLLPAWEGLAEDALPVPPVTPPRAIAACRRQAKEWWGLVCAGQPGAVLAPAMAAGAPSSASSAAAAGGGGAADGEGGEDPFGGPAASAWIAELRGRHGAAPGAPLPAELELAAVQAAARWAAAAARQRQSCSKWGLALVRLHESITDEAGRKKAVQVGFWRALGPLRRCPDVWAARAQWQRCVAGDAPAAGKTFPAWAGYLEEGARSCWRDSDLLLMTASDSLERTGAGDVARGLVEWRVKQGTASGSPSEWQPLREPAAPASDVLLCHWIRLSRRTQGADAARRVFVEARREASVGPGLYLTAAMVELRSNGDKEKALQMLELGRRYHPHDPNLACAAVDILVEKGDARNARAVLQAALAQVHPSCAPSLWERWMDLELRGQQGGGGLEAAEQVEWKRALAMPGAYWMPPFAGTDASTKVLVEQAETERAQRAPGSLPIIADPSEVASRGAGAALGAFASLLAGLPSDHAGPTPAAPAVQKVPALLRQLHRHQHAGLMPAASADEESLASVLPSSGSAVTAAASLAGDAAKPLAWSVEAADGQRDFSGIGSATIPPSMVEAENAAVEGMNGGILQELPMAAVCHAGVSAGDATVTAELAEQGPSALLGAGIRASSQMAPVAASAEVSTASAAGGASSLASAPAYDEKRKKLAADFARMRSLMAAPPRITSEAAEAVPQRARRDILAASPYLLRLVALLDVAPVGEDAEEQLELCLAGLETAAQSSATAPTRPSGLPQELDVVADEAWLAEGEVLKDGGDSSGGSEETSAAEPEGAVAGSKRKRADSGSAGEGGSGKADVGAGAGGGAGASGVATADASGEEAEGGDESAAGQPDTKRVRTNQ